MRVRLLIGDHVVKLIPSVEAKTKWSLRSGHRAEKVAIRSRVQILAYPFASVRQDHSVPSNRNFIVALLSSHPPTDVRLAIVRISPFKKGHCIAELTVKPETKIQRPVREVQLFSDAEIGLMEPRQPWG